MQSNACAASALSSAMSRIFERNERFSLCGGAALEEQGGGCEWAARRAGLRLAGFRAGMGGMLRCGLSRVLPGVQRVRYRDYVRDLDGHLIELCTPMA
jgi:hypothetical protein